MCEENKNTLLDLNFATATDDVNWVTIVPATVQTDEGKLKMKFNSATGMAERTIGTLEPLNNRLQIKINYEVKNLSAIPNTTSLVFRIKNTSGVILFESKVVLQLTESGKIYKYLLDRVFEYNGNLGAVKLSVFSISGYENEVNLINFKAYDFTYCNENVRSYFILDDIQNSVLNAQNKAFQLTELKIDDTETLTADFFADTITVGSTTSDWKYAKSELDGTVRVADAIDPYLFNPFISDLKLTFSATNYFSGKPTAVTNGKNYGAGIMNIGTEKPFIYNGGLQEKVLPFFIDIDYTKNFKMRFSVIINTTNTDLFTNPTIYRDYVIEWNKMTCLKTFTYVDRLRNETVNDYNNGFLSGVSPYDTKTQEEVIVFDADYIVLTYNFTDGRDLDTRTRIVTPDIGQNDVSKYLGWGLRQNFPSGVPEDAIISFGGDNTGTGLESVLIDITKLKELQPDADVLVTDFRAFWYGTVGYQKVNLKSVFYKGGEIVRRTPEYGFSNPTAEDTLEFDTQGDYVPGPINKTALFSGYRIATFTYTISTGVGIFVIGDTVTPSV